MRAGRSWPAARRIRGPHARNLMALRGSLRGSGFAFRVSSYCKGMGPVMGPVSDSGEGSGFKAEVGLAGCSGSVALQRSGVHQRPGARSTAPGCDLGAATVDTAGRDRTRYGHNPVLTDNTRPEKHP